MTHVPLSPFSSFRSCPHPLSSTFTMFVHLQSFVVRLHTNHSFTRIPVYPSPPPPPSSPPSPPSKSSRARMMDIGVLSSRCISVSPSTSGSVRFSPEPSQLPHPSSISDLTLHLAPHFARSPLPHLPPHRTPHAQHTRLLRPALLRPQQPHRRVHLDEGEGVEHGGDDAVAVSSPFLHARTRRRPRSLCWPRRAVLPPVLDGRGGGEEGSHGNGVGGRRGGVVVCCVSVAFLLIREFDSLTRE